MSDLERLYSLSDEELEAEVKAVKSGEFETEEEEPEVTEDVTEEFETQEDDELEEELNDDEQPSEEDSDHDTSEDETDEESEDDDSDETDEDNPDGDSEEDETEDTETDETEEEDSQPAQKLVFKANGKDYEFTEDEMRNKFPVIFGQAMDYTKKLQTIKPWRKTIDAIESAKLQHNDVNLMIDVLKGDKDALAEVIKRTGIDTLDLDLDESKYVAKDYGRDDNALAIKDIVDEISKDKEYDTTEEIVSRQWDDKSWKEMSSNPTLIKLLHQDVKDGVYNVIQPIAEKLKVYDGATKSDLDYYKEAAMQHSAQLQAEYAKENSRKEELSRKKVQQQEKQKVQEVKTKQATREKTKASSAKRKAATLTSNRASKENTAIDFLNMSDAEWDKYYEEVMSKAP